ncbi:hypothetical protein DdX_15746 [Ditylenchus destructor]|uniref:F-box domain-containing protein n=1 Tax=Ditylenchus destructor TaxID=166010 RepID=A0AAD4MUG8_9BILA|nr:hypothetical protein DdX_15746 [Ditylenchus destructor]
MRRSVRLAEKQAKPSNEAQREPRAKKKRSDGRTSNIATLDNGTMVESFKYLNYMQLAKSSLVSKRFSNLIRTNRHRLALLYVDEIRMNDRTYIRILDKELSPGEYNEWVIRNGYSKEISMESPAAMMRSQQYWGQVYKMRADYEDPQLKASTTVLKARVELSHHNWPLFQHFVRLLTDPFIYINYLRLIPLIDISYVNLLAEAMISDSSRIRCGKMELYSNRANIEDNVQKFISWSKNHVLCKEFQVSYDSDTNFDEEMLDLFVAGAHFTSAININNCDISNVIVAFLQKFMSLQDCDENQMVESIQCRGSGRVIEVLKRDYAKFIVKEEKYEVDDITEQLFELESSLRAPVFELFNTRIGKKLKISARIIVARWVYFDMDIENL